jgi:serine/threonine protein kinase
MTQALIAWHAAALIHGDIKPANIVVERPSAARCTDTYFESVLAFFIDAEGVVSMPLPFCKSI